MTSTNCITGDRLVSKTSDAYRDGYDKIFLKGKDGESDAIFDKKGREVQPEKRLILNQVKCNICNDIITSKHRHDYVSCTCGNLHIDGGLDYAKRSFKTPDFTDMSIYADEGDISNIRNYFTWASYGKNGDEPKHYILLRELTTGHIKAILLTQKHVLGTYVENILRMELEFRNDSGR
jgi:hypothetical protein